MNIDPELVAAIVVGGVGVGLGIAKGLTKYKEHSNRPPALPSNADESGQFSAGFSNQDRDRLFRLETRVADLERSNDSVHSSTKRQWDEIRSVSTELKLTREQMSGLGTKIELLTQALEFSKLK